LFLLGLAGALWLVASPPPPPAASRDLFGFASARRAASEIDVPAIRRFAARDGEQLAYRVYDSAAERMLIFVHGSSYHGAGYHPLAAALSRDGAATVVLPNLRGHHQSGRRRGDTDHIGQLEEDIFDLIQVLRAERRTGPITLGGHSSGGGLAIRFAGGAYADAVASYLLLSPTIPRSPAIRQGNAGGWAQLHWRRLYGLLALNAVGIHGLDGLPVVEFNKPVQFWDGTETLSYSYRLNVSYHPRYRYETDIRALGGRALVLVGADDEAIDPEALRILMAANAPQAQVTILPQTTHFGIFTDPRAFDAITGWLRTLP
jgi:pimeloyl-ACP methyl ester carboxylesterase